jgi:predicted HAD superfamily Cof-like phosphohydrolase
VAILDYFKSEHQKRVDDFMRLAKQELPEKPTEPSEAVRLLRAKLIFEEAIETIRALGVVIYVPAEGADMHTNVDCAEFEISPTPFNLIEVIDGCCDIKVVTTGTLSACGVPDKPFQEDVDRNNLEKFGPGHYWRGDGKLMKPPGHRPPDMNFILRWLLDVVIPRSGRRIEGVSVGAPTGNWGGINEKKQEPSDPLK